MASNSKFAKYLKWIVVGFYKDTMINEDGSVLGYAPTAEQQRICCKLVHLVLDDNGFFKPDTKNWLTKTKNFGEGAENDYTSRSRINYDIGKLKKALGESATEKIYGKKDGYQQYESLIESLSEKYSSRSILDDLIFPVNHREIVSNPVDTNGIYKMDCLDLFSSYSKKNVKAAEKSVTPQMISYIKYLENNRDSLSGEDREIWEALIETL